MGNDRINDRIISISHALDGKIDLRRRKIGFR
jgi:hypothetical protein